MHFTLHSLLTTKIGAIVMTMMAMQGSTVDLELSVDEKVDRIIEDKQRREMEAWTMMPRLFDTWGKS